MSRKFEEADQARIGALEEVASVQS